MLCKERSGRRFTQGAILSACIAAAWVATLVDAMPAHAAEAALARIARPPAVTALASARPGAHVRQVRVAGGARHAPYSAAVQIVGLADAVRGGIRGGG